MVCTEYKQKYCRLTNSTSKTSHVTQKLPQFIKLCLFVYLFQFVFGVLFLPHVNICELPAYFMRVLHTQCAFFAFSFTLETNTFENKNSKCSNDPYLPYLQDFFNHLPYIITHHEHLSCFMQLYNKNDCRSSSFPVTLSP